MKIKSRRSLRWRLILAMTLVTFAASAIVGLALDRFTEREFRQFLEVEMEVAGVELPNLDELDQLLSLDQRDEAVAEIGRLADQSGHRMLLFDATERLLFDSDPQGDDPILLEGELELRMRSQGERATDERIRLRGGVTLGDIEGRSATLFVLPTIDTATEPSPEIEFERRVSRARLIGVIIATLIALAIATLLSRQILRPVERLTIAAERLSEGDLSQRVDLRGEDELSALGGAFNTMAASLERAEASRRNMTSDVAHELRTPLTHLRCKLESAQDRLIPIDAKLIEELQTEIVHLSRLVDDLQELSLAESGRLPLHPSEVRVQDQLEQVIAALPKGDRFPRVEFAIEGDAGVTAFVDADRLKQVVRNLLENAIRYGEGEVDLILRTGAGESGATVLVNDRGPGIPPGQEETIFDRFHRTDPSRDRATGGTGLGLTISRELVLGWGGELGVTARRGGGSSFWFTLPSRSA